MQGLHDTSLTHAFKQGGWEHYGWGQDRLIATDVYDGLALNTEASARLKTPLERWPRPSKKSSDGKPKKKATVADLWNGLPAHAKGINPQLQK